MSSTLVARPGRAAVALLGVLAIAICACDRSPSAPSEDGPRLRIVSLVPSATEILFALRAGEYVVGRSSHCDWPPVAERIPPFGDAIAPDLEGVAGCAPDVVFVGSRAQVEALRMLPGRVRVERVSPDRISEVREAIRRVAALVGAVEAGEGLLGEIDDALSGAPPRLSSGESLRVLFVVQREPLIVAGGGSYVGELVEAIGAENVAGDLERPWPTLSFEALVARDPDVILDASLAPERDDLDVAEYWGRFHTLSAVRRGRLRRAGAPCLVRPGPRLPEAVRELSRLVWGDR